MKHQAPGLIAAALFVGAAAPVLADRTLPIFDLVESGLLCPTVVVGEREAPDTVSGILRLIDADQPVAVHTSRVPRLLGAEFGVRMSLTTGAEPIAAQVVVTHPPMPPTMQTVERWQTTLTAEGNSIVAFTFETVNELLPGEWSFALVAEGTILLERTFTVVDGLTLDYQKLCEGPALMS